MKISRVKFVSKYNLENLENKIIILFQSRKSLVLERIQRSFKKKLNILIKRQLNFLKLKVTTIRTLKSIIF